MYKLLETEIQVFKFETQVIFHFVIRFTMTNCLKCLVSNTLNCYRMKLTLKTLSRDTFDVEIDENLKVSDLKKKVEEVRGPSHPAQNLKLIYAGTRVC